MTFYSIHKEILIIMFIKKVVVKICKTVPLIINLVVSSQNRSATKDTVSTRRTYLGGSNQSGEEAYCV